MFNAEKLLGKLVGEITHTGGSWGKGKKASPLGALTSGSGLMTLIGLGVGVYEILKQQGQQQQAGGPGSVPPPPPGSAGYGQAAPPPPPPPGGGMTTPPPPQAPGIPTVAPSVPVASPPSQAAVQIPAGQARADLAVRMIQVMVAAAHADGVMDEQEERAVLDRLRGAELTQEERLFLLGELHQPKSIEQLTEGVTDPGVARTMYLLAKATATIDTEAERAWFDQLASRLGLSKEIQAFIEEQY